MSYLHKFGLFKRKIAELSLGNDLRNEPALVTLFPKQTGRVEDSVYLLGNYELTYADGTTALLPVRYGTHLTTCNIDDPVSNQSYSEMIGGTRPKKYGNVYYYECAYENPDPEKQIVGIRYIPAEDKKDVKVYVKKIILPEAKIGTGTETEETEKAHIFQ